ncbi:CACTA en-spm transposon protein [Cucumis melo var. makuwa]|uniref:CACTA en-spm transposon protein n=1 Tax=Cucumis melo var. makuwa TaxID=1194695 RepID=A0A5D3BB26_CUCMM|nr:CACTA en-spm transposon protein [Cucumis melo var. makuwa]TYJ95568.1 CACTA en-spm transposon protein [Cucumis melo var. makuwa]
MGNNSASTFQPSVTPTPRRHAQSRLLELEHYVAGNRRILMTIAPGAEKPIFPHIVCFSQKIGTCLRKTFLVCCLKWADVGKECIELIKANLQMLSTFKEFQSDCHRHFKNCSDPKEAHANPSHLLIGHDED